MSTEIAIRKQLQDTISGQDQADYKPHVSSRSWSYVNDQQNGSYSNQISFDLSGIVSQQAFMALQEAYILVPFSIKMTASRALTGAIPNTACCLKDNAYANFIDSIQLFVNNKQLIDQTTMSNIPIQIMDKLKMSASNLKQFGSGLGISPDTTTSINTSFNTASATGDGYYNNIPVGADTWAGLKSVNTGVQDRLLTSINTVTGTGLTIAQASLIPYFSVATTNNVGASWNSVLNIPLRRISDLFDKYPLVKGSQIRLVINFNAGSSAITAETTNGTTLNLASIPVMTAGNTLQAMMITKAVTGAWASAGTETLTISTQIQSTSAAATTTMGALGYPALPQCRLFVPLLKVNPTYEERILANRHQTHRYLDWYQSRLNNQASGPSFSQTLTTALPNVKILIGVPFANTSVSSSVFTSAATGTPQYQSVFDTAPATTVPYGASCFQNFNVQVNGINILSQNANYTFDMWNQQLSKLTCNGGLSREISSGLVDMRSWNFSPFVIVDLSDRPESSEDTYQSITVSGTNSSGVALDYLWYVGFEKVGKWDVITGDVQKVFG